MRLINWINSRPPVSWLARLFGFLAGPVDRWLDDPARAWNRRRVAQYRDLAERCRTAGLHESAMKLARTADVLERRS